MQQYREILPEGMEIERHLGLAMRVVPCASSSTIDAGSVKVVRVSIMMGYHKSRVSDSQISPPHSRGRRRGFAEHRSAPPQPQPARDAARAVEGAGG